MAFRALVRSALADPLGGPLSRRFTAPLVTAVVGSAQGDRQEDIALVETLDALARAGIPRGRMFVLLAGEEVPSPATRARAQSLRLVLGVPVLPHDPDRDAHYVAGHTSSGVAVRLDDELREAEALVVVGEMARDRVRGPHGGPLQIHPGLAARASAAAQGAGAADGHALATAREASAIVGVDFALVWNQGDPPQVRAGEGLALFDALLAEGWLSAR